MSMSEAKEHPKLEMSANVERETVSVWRNAIGLDADIYRPKGLSEDSKVSGVVLSHGWGGDKLTAERYAAKCASKGMTTLSFSHSTWGESGGNVVLLDDAPELDANNEATVRVGLIRQLIDPMDWAQNYRAATDYLEGEPNVDSDRIGAKLRSIEVPTWIIDAGNEELMNIEESGDGYERSSQLACDWFCRYLQETE